MPNTTYNRVSLVSPVDGFGQLATVQRTPLISLKSNYGISVLRDIVATTGSGTVTNDRTEYACSTGTTSGSTALLTSAQRGRYVAGTESDVGLGIRLDHTFQGTQFVRWGYYDDDNGFGFGKDASGLFVFVRRAGSDEKFYQPAWNVEQPVITLEKGNIFQIRFLWYGFGPIRWQMIGEVQNQPRQFELNRFFPNAQTSVANPNLPLSLEAGNGDTSEDVTIYVAGRQYSVVGEYDPSFRVTGDRRIEQTVGTTFLPSVSYRKKEGFRDVRVLNESLEVLTDANALVQLRLNATLTDASFGTPTDHTASETGIETDTGATAISGGEILYSDLVSTAGSGRNKAGGSSLRGILLEIPETDTVSIALRSLSSVGATMSSLLQAREEW